MTNSSIPFFHRQSVSSKFFIFKYPAFHSERDALESLSPSGRTFEYQRNRRPSYLRRGGNIFAKFQRLAAKLARTQVKELQPLRIGPEYRGYTSFTNGIKCQRTANGYTRCSGRGFVVFTRCKWSNAQVQIDVSIDGRLAREGCLNKVRGK